MSRNRWIAHEGVCISMNPDPLSMPDPLVSVLMPVADPAPWLDEAVASILEQSEPRFELLIVDDGMSVPLLHSSRPGFRDPRVRVIRLEEQRGLVTALNTGLGAARGTYVARMDADDVAHPDRLQKQVGWMEAHPEWGLVSCRVRYVREDGGGRGYERHVDWCNRIVSPGQIEQSRFVESPCPHPSVLFRRELIAKHGGYLDGKFPEDYELWLRWLEQGVRMGKVEDELLAWRDSADRLSRTDSRYAVSAFYDCKAGYLARWLQRHNPHHPDVWVWGAGRTTRQRAAFLVEKGIRIAGFIDIDPKKVGQQIGGVPVCSPEDLPAPHRCFVIPYVGSRGARCKIESYLQQRAFVPGIHYIAAA